MSISVGDAVLKLGVDTKDLDRGMRGLKGTIQKHNKAIGLAMTAMGGAILAAGALSIKTFAAMGDEVQKMALRTGFSTEALSELRHAAELSGTSLSSLEKASKTLSGAILDAGFGLETYVRAFDKIGLSYEQLKGLSPEDQFLAVMEALAGVTDESEKAALAADIFGRAGTQLLPMLADGTEGLAEMRQEAHDLGIVFDKEAADKAAGFNDAMTRLKSSVNGVKVVIAENLIPVLEPLINKMKDIISGITAWIKENPGLAQTITVVTAAMGVLATAFGPLLIFLPQLTAAYTIIRGIMLVKLIPAIVATTAALWAKVAALYAAMVAMGPTGWAMAAASMAIIAGGLVLIIKKAKDATSAFTGEVDQYTPAAREADNATRQWSEGLAKLEVVTRRITDAEDKLGAVEEKLREQSRGVAHVRSFLIRQGDSLADVLEQNMLKTEGLSASYEDFVDVILAMEDPSDRHIKYLREYVKLKEEATEAEREHQRELEETNRLLEEQAEAQKDATEKVEDAIEALRYERSEAGRLGITIDDVAQALYLMGRENEYLADTLVALGDESDNVNAVLDAVGLTAEQVSEKLGRAAEEATRVGDAFKTMMDRIRHADTEAGKLNITMFDIYDAMEELGYSLEAIGEYYKVWGMEIGSVNSALEELGFTAEEVAILVGILTDEARKAELLKIKIPGVTPKVPEDGELMTPEEYERITEKIAKGGRFASEKEAIAYYKATAAREGRIWERGVGVVPGAAGLTKAGVETALETVRLQLARGIEQGLEGLVAMSQAQLLEIGARVSDLYPATIPVEEAVPAQHGGIAMNPMTVRVAERRPEALIPLDKFEGLGGYRTADIRVYLDSRTLAQAIGQPLVDEIRLRTGIHA